MTPCDARFLQWSALQGWIASRKPTWGTCAGMVLMADGATGVAAGGQALLGGMDIEVNRNFFGSQLASFEAQLTVDDADLRSALATAYSHERSAHKRATALPPGIFIRAPAVVHVGPRATALAWVATPDVPGGRVAVAVREGPFLATAFHPELSGSSAWHSIFADFAARGGSPTFNWQAPGVATPTSDATDTLQRAGGSTPSCVGGESVFLTPGTSAASSFRTAGSTHTGGGAGAAQPLSHDTDFAAGNELARGLASRVINARLEDD